MGGVTCLTRSIFELTMVPEHWYFHILRHCCCLNIAVDSLVVKKPGVHIKKMCLSK